ncbi:hypothetical protein AB0M94_38290 [Streptomyces xanthochromogenes]|uniref:Uncharacterized protein n=1 Tax=Streptomyces xanthochromogenes TaxID=67384 RepID=A0ABQ3AB75_9ACTN|nr:MULTISPECIES: hypothetical protein [Streptomyces]GGY40387.1 hypothetical protein GCM10010326_37990 [Streptomyces xanthochromogenes]
MNAVTVQAPKTAAPGADDVFDLVIGDLEQDLPQAPVADAPQNSTCIRVYCILD